MILNIVLSSARERGTSVRLITNVFIKLCKTMRKYTVQERVFQENPACNDLNLCFIFLTVTGFYLDIMQLRSPCLWRFHKHLPECSFVVSNVVLFILSDRNKRFVGWWLIYLVCILTEGCLIDADYIWHCNCSYTREEKLCKLTLTQSLFICLVPLCLNNSHNSYLLPRVTLAELADQYCWCCN